MILNKAIEILHLNKTGNYEGGADDLEKAHQMGIEALERIQDMRRYKTLIGLASSVPSRLLPSETGEQEVQEKLETQAK